MFLSVKGGQTVFRDFLKSEFCEENLDFWLSCQEFKGFDDPEELTRRATKIYEEFIRADAPKQVKKTKNKNLLHDQIKGESLQQYVLKAKKHFRKCSLHIQ